MTCEYFLFTFVTIGALACGVLAGWLFGFVHGIYWKQK